MQNPFLGIRAALFDLDGTLVRTHIDFPLMKREIVSLARAYDVEMDELEQLDILTGIELVRSRLAELNKEEEADRFRACAFARLEEIEVDQCATPEPIAGAADLLDALKSKGIKIGVVTRNCRTVSLRLLENGGLHYDALLTRDDVPRTKPDPGHLLATLSALGLNDLHPIPDTRHPIPAVMVGDHWMDVQAGRAAGLRTVGLLLGRPVELFSPCRPDLMVDELQELLPLALRCVRPNPSEAVFTTLNAQHSPL